MIDSLFARPFAASGLHSSVVSIAREQKNMTAGGNAEYTVARKPFVI